MPTLRRRHTNGLNVAIYDVLHKSYANEISLCVMDQPVPSIIPSVQSKIFDWNHFKSCSTLKFKGNGAMKFENYPQITVLVCFSKLLFLIDK